MDVTGYGSCVMASFVISGVEPEFSWCYVVS